MLREKRREKGLLLMDNNQGSIENEKNNYKEADEKQNRN